MAERTALKYSRQRESIRDYLASTKTHPTADAVYDEVRKQYPKISLGTVYRNLALLSELGQVNTVAAGDGREHYDGNVEPHSHFICRDCGKIYDLPHQAFDCEPVIKKSGFSGTIDHYSTTFYGRCGDCAKKARSR